MPMPWRSSQHRRPGAWPAWSAWQASLLAVLLLSAGLPIAWTALQAIRQASDAAGWHALLQSPQLGTALSLSLWTGLLSTALSWYLSAWLLSTGFVQRRLDAWLKSLPAMLATPHVALAIGLVFLLAPSGWLLRLVSPSLTGFDLPPPWQTTQDPWGLGLVLALCAKEIPFLLWVAAAQLQREDLRRVHRAEHVIALTLGHAPGPAFAHVVWPQLRPRLAWPALAVLAYSMTVVDMALVIGPTTPPTLAVLAWQWLQDADPLAQQQGAAAAGLLAVCVALLGAVLVTILRVQTPRQAALRGPGWAPAESRSSWRMPRHERPLLRASSAPSLPRVGKGSAAFWGLRALYALALAALAVGSLAGLWPFPDVLPSVWTFNAWQSVWQSRATLLTTLTLAAASAGLALAWSVAWLEVMPRRWEARLRPALYLTLLMPGVLWVLGMHALSLYTRLDGAWLGVMWAHFLMALPYVVMALSPSYLGFERRYAPLTASLGHGRWAFLLHIKWPLLKGGLSSAFAVGFAVSVAQYLPTLYIGAGRFSTVTTESVALAAGAQRSLTSAYAWLQWVLPLLVFAAAAWVGRARQFKAAPASQTEEIQ